MPVIPETYKARILSMQGDKGNAWLESLENCLSRCQKRWNLEIGQSFDLSYNYVTSVSIAGSSEAVLKICLPDSLCHNELRALRIHKDCMCRVIDSMEDEGVLLLEKLAPGENLQSVADESEAVRLASSILVKMRKVSPMSPELPTQRDHHKDIMKMSAFQRTHGLPFGDSITDKMQKRFEELVASEDNTYVLHGDFHHGNILSHHGEWKLIDPKGVVGETEYEIVPFLMNNIPARDFESIIEKRISMFSENLALDTRRLNGWCVCRSVLSAWWNVEDNLGTYALDLALIQYFAAKT